MKKINENTSINNLDDYLLKLEQQEKVKSRNRGFIFLGIAGILLLGFVLVQFALPDNSLKVYQFNDLDSDLLSDLLEKDQLPILVNHPDLGTDTIFDLDDYATLLNLSYSIEANKGLKVVDESNLISSKKEKSSINELPFLALDIIGKREKGQKLKFLIENFDEEISYEIDFGNGYKTKMNKAATYKYPRSGNYRIKLIAKQGNQSRIYIKKIRIERKKEQIAQQISRDNNSVAVEKQNIPETPASPIINEIEDLDETLKEKIEDSDVQSEVNDLQTIDLKEEETESIKTLPPTLPSDIEVAEKPVAKVETEAAKVKVDASPIPFAQLMPEFPGGPGSFSKFIRKNYRYPQKAVNYGIEGVVSVRFVVNSDGSLSNPYVIKGIGYGCDEEAIRLISKMPKWIPGENDGKKVAVYQTIPVTFKLEE